MTWRSGLAWLLAACAAACDPPAPPAERPLPPAVAVAPARQAAPGYGASVGFRSRRQLEEHAAKHQADLGTPDAAAYLHAAQTLRDALVGGDILEIRRADGVTTRFDRSTGRFVAFNPDGTLRTFFRPNDGEAYFRRQARRPPDP